MRAEKRTAQGTVGVQKQTVLRDSRSNRRFNKKQLAEHEGRTANQHRDEADSPLEMLLQDRSARTTWRLLLFLRRLRRPRPC